MPAVLPQIRTKPARLLGPRTIITASLYGLSVLIPVFASMVVISVLQFGIQTFLIPLATIGLATFFLPLGFGNPYVCRLIRPLKPPHADDADIFVVQLTRNPRIRSGLMAIFEDADDIGYLNLAESALEFHGDSIQLSVPYGLIEKLRLRSAGWRAMFAYGAQTTFSVAGLTDAGDFMFAERSSWILPASRKNANRMYQRLVERIQGSDRQPVSDPHD
jgi:hypothetical protein